MPKETFVHGPLGLSLCPLSVYIGILLCCGSVKAHIYVVWNLCKKYKLPSQIHNVGTVYITLN